MNLSIGRAFTCAVAFALCSFFNANLDGTASAATSAIENNATVAGSVTSSDGAPVRDASISLQGGGEQRAGRTNAAGRFRVVVVAAGTYAIRVQALGYDALGPLTIGVRQMRTTEVNLALVRSSSSLATIGRVQAGSTEALSTSAAPVSTLNAQTYAGEGYTRISDVVQDDISTTLVHPLGGGSTVLPTSVALRGPDPTETLVDIDGHPVNSGNTGDFDLSLLDPADFSSIELVKGISPSSLVGPDTIDGAINIRTLEPTFTPHGQLRFSAGSFNSFGETLAATGTRGRLGYAFSVHRTTTDGAVNEPIFDTTTGSQAHVGSGVDGSTLVGKIRYAFGRGGDGYAELGVRDQSVFRDLSAALSSYSAPETSTPALTGSAAGLPLLHGFEGSALEAHDAGYSIDVRAPLGAANAGGVAASSVLFRHYTSLVAQSVFGSAAQTSPYLYNARDLGTDDSLAFERQSSNGALTLQYAIRNEHLDTDFLAGVVNDQAVMRQTAFNSSQLWRTFDTGAAALQTVPSKLTLAQTQRSAVIRYAYDPTAKLHLTAATYYSDYSLFGHSLDPRFSVVYTPDARSAIRFSVGSTYQAPHLPELFVPAILPSAVGNYITVGNPNLQPDRATEYGLGVSRLLQSGAHQTDVSADLYRVNLRTPAATYLPPLDQNCGAVAAGGDGTLCPLSYPVNAGDAIYQGIELWGQRRITRYVSVHAGYAVRSAFLTSVPSSIANGTLVANEQNLGLPLHKASLAIQGAQLLGTTFRAALTYEGAYNELNAPPFATLNASIGYRWPAIEIIVAGTNLTNVYAGHFTRIGAGVPYAGPDGPVATNSYALAGSALTLSVARRF